MSATSGAIADNPATRLKFWVNVMMTHPDGPLIEAVATGLGLDSVALQDLEIRVQVVQASAQIALLPPEVRREAMLLPEEADADILLEDFQQLEAASSVLLSPEPNPVSSFTHALSGVEGGRAIRSLDLLERQLHRQRAQPVIAEDVRIRLLQLVEDLKYRVEHDDALDDDLRAFILVRFGAVEQALRDAITLGVGPVEIVAQSLIGSRAVQPGLWERIGESTFASAVGSIVAGLFLSLAVPPSPAALPPGTPQVVVEQYTVIITGDNGHVTAEQINTFITDDDHPHELNAPATDEPAADDQ